MTVIKYFLLTLAEAFADGEAITKNIHNKYIYKLCYIQCCAVRLNFNRVLRTPLPLGAVEDCLESFDSRSLTVGDLGGSGGNRPM